MAYAVRYQAEFNSTGQQPYTVQILQKDYVGSVSGLMLSGTPVKHSWQTDEPKAAIKGSSLTLSLYNDGSLPITTFYSPNDDEFKIRYYWNTQLLFEGFLVQDDCSELMVDYKHEIVLSFNDNLGLLKDIALDENPPDFGAFLATVMLDFVSPVPDNFIYIYNTTFIPVVSTPFTISGHIDPIANDTFTPTAVTYLGNGNYKVQVVDLAFGADTVAWPVQIAGAGTIDLYRRNTLLNIIRVCLYNTGLELNTRVYANLFETEHDVNHSFLEQTYIDTQAFLSDKKFDDCYKVLTYILERFHLTLFQAYGSWNIIRHDELRYYPSLKDVPFFLYDSEFTLQSTGVLNNNFITGFEQVMYPEVGLTRSIFRPFKFSEETFNYRQPKYLLKNFDLLDLGALITSYVDGATTVYEYEATDWFPATSPQPDYFIRVVTNTSTGDELERYVVVEGATGDSARSIVSTPFEVSAGDRITVNYTFRTNVSQAGPATVVLAVLIYDGTTSQYADEDKTVNWKTGLGWNFLIASGGDTNTNQSVTIDPLQIPYDGLIYIYLPQAVDTAGATDETQIKDIRVTYTPYINDSTKIIGHVHNNEQSVTIKNNEDVEVFADDSPRNSVAGTLFRPSFTGLLQDRTSQWYRITNPSEELRIGQITTFEQLFWRRVPRTKLEGSFLGLVQNSGTVQSYTGVFDYYMLSSPFLQYAISATSIPAGLINVGAVLTVTDTVSNNGTFTVIGIQGSGGLFPVGSYLVAEPIVTEPGSSSTIEFSSVIHISMLAALKNVAFSDLNFVFGSLEIDYRNNSLNCTQWELCDDTEVDGDLTSDYSFTYLYDSK